MGLVLAETAPEGRFLTFQLPLVEFGDKVSGKMHLAQALGGLAEGSNHLAVDPFG